MNQLKEKTWKDEAGVEIPASRITATEKLREKMSDKVLKTAQAASAALSELKELIRQASEQVYEQTMKDNKVEGKNGKGNFTWYNFDRSIRIEVSINERIDFDETLIAVAKEKLEIFLKGNLEGTEEMVRQLVMDAFNTSRGKLDSKKVLSLLKYKSRIKAGLFQEALECIEKAIRRPDSKTYHRVAFKNAEGGYDYVELNFSAI
ncbi:MAG: DUF3164 family protein [Bacteroidia bacterium]